MAFGPREQQTSNDPRAQLLARAAESDVRADRHLAGSIADLFLDEDARLDDQTRVAVATLIAAMVEAVEGEVRKHAARLIAARGEAMLADIVTRPGDEVLQRLVESGVLREPEFMSELLARTRQSLIAARLVPPPTEHEGPSLLARLSDDRDGIVASGAMAMLIAESRRAGEPQQLARTDLSAELHHKLVWWVAAGIRDSATLQEHGPSATLDRALAEAAMRSLGAHDEGERLEAIAVRLASALDPQPDELPGLLADAVADRRLALMIALIAHALGIEYELAREIVLDRAGERLSLVLRALEVPPPSIAVMMFALSEADPRRDATTLADLLDALRAITPGEARAALMPLTLHPDFRSALLALGRRAAR